MERVAARWAIEGFDVTNEMLGIIGVCLGTGILILLRRLLLTVGRGARPIRLIGRVQAVNRRLRLVGSGEETKPHRPHPACAKQASIHD